MPDHHVRHGGARQGWCEAPYTDIPVELTRITDGAIAVRCGVMDMRILPGLCRRDPGRPDVMRGEETQLLGLLAHEQPGLVVIPGTHSKWVMLAGATVTDFRTVMTGEIYALLCRHSVLRHTIAESHEVTPTADFADGVRAGLDDPAAVLASAFAVRAGGLLFGRAGREAAAWLSGLLIGAEVGAALARAADAEVTILGAGALAGLYDHAITAAGRYSRIRDGEAAAARDFARRHSACGRRKWRDHEAQRRATRSKANLVWRNMGATTMADSGLITAPSAHGVKETIDRLEADVKSKGMTVFARIDHAAGAKEAGLALRPTELLIFGNAKGGTPLMQAFQTIGIDLPLKALAWEDAAGKVWLSYNEPTWLAARHGDAAQVGAVTKVLGAALEGLAKKAAGP